VVSPWRSTAWCTWVGLVRAAVANWQLAVAGAILSTAAYGIAIWAMTMAPIALTAALREPVLPTRIVAALVVLAGMALMRLG
jgi:hypothetical protein